MNCTGCPALRGGIKNGQCALKVRVGTVKKDGRLERHPMETCPRPKNDRELAEQLEIIAKSAD